MAIPTIFTQQGTNAIASYNWTDIASGNGTVVFYATPVNLSTGLKYVLYENTFYTPTSGYNNTTDRRDDNNYKTSTTAVAATKVIDLDFDTLAFNIPRIVSGDFLANVAWNINVLDSSSYCNFYLKVIVKKLATDGTTETDLLTLQSNTLGNDAGASGVAYNDVYFTLSGTIPKTTFAIGEKVRVTTEFWVSDVTVGKTMYPVILLDPKNRAVTLSSPYTNSSAGYTQTSFVIPFKVDT